MIAFSCGCGTTIKVPSEMKGKKGKCPKCGTALVVPGGAATPAPGAAAAKKDSETFDVASRDLTGSKPMALSGDLTESQVVADEGDDAEELTATPATPTSTTPTSTTPTSTTPTSTTPTSTKTGTRRASVMRFKCPHCSKTLTVPLKLAGETGKCASCQQRFTAPVPEPVKQMRAQIMAKRASETSLRDTFSIVKVRCQCGMTSAIPRGRAASHPKCPACDRLLQLDVAEA